MKAEVKQVEQYTLTIEGIQYHNFRKDGEWNGMVKMVDTDGNIVILDEPTGNSFDDLFGSIFEEIFSGKAKPPITEFVVVKASTSLFPKTEKKL